MTSVRRQTQHKGLSKRSVEILRLLADGLSDREIAEQLTMTLNTVKWYNRQIYSVLGVGNRTQAVTRAHDLHLLVQPDSSESPPEALPPSPKQNLPAEATHFIGRKHEIEMVKRRLETVRLLTLVGTPGTGKTRLALRVAQEVAASFRDGVYFVSLAPISDPGWVINTIASTIGVNEAHDQALIKTLKQVLRESQIMLILDNFEHLLLAAPQVSELLAAAPHLKVLATSREPLHLYGEQEYTVPPLELPDPEHIDSQTVAACESAALFIQQAQAVKPDFVLTAENALDVAKICVRLEGLPLAIELAAARIKLLPPQAMLARLDSRLDALTGAMRDLPPRQQTLRRTIDWSHNLLNEDEKQLFARLAVFRGGRSLEAIETVCGQGMQMDLLEGIESLLNKNLLMQQKGADEEPRFVMLETLHEYAWERLQASDEARLLRRRHAEYFTTMAERAEPELRQSGFTYWMRRLDLEHHNLLLALECSLSDGDTELGLRLIAALRDFWVMSGRLLEGMQWTERGLSKSRDAPPALRARLYTAAGFELSLLTQQARARQVMEEAVAIARELDDRLIYAWALTFRGGASIGQSQEYEQAVSCVEEGLALFRATDCKPGMVQGFCILGELNRANADDERAQMAYEQALDLTRETGEKRHESMMLVNLGFIAMHHGDIDHAQWLFREGLIKALELAYDRHLIVTNFVPLAGTIAAKGQPKRAVLLYGAAEALLELMGVGLQVGDQPEYARDLAFVRAQLDAATFKTAWAEGRAMTLEQAIAYALEP